VHEDQLCPTCHAEQKIVIITKLGKHTCRLLFGADMKEEKYTRLEFFKQKMAINLICLVLSLKIGFLII